MSLVARSFAHRLLLAVLLAILASSVLGPQARAQVVETVPRSPAPALGGTTPRDGDQPPGAGGLEPVELPGTATTKPGGLQAPHATLQQPLAGYEALIIVNSVQEGGRTASQTALGNVMVQRYRAAGYRTHLLVGPRNSGVIYGALADIADDYINAWRSTTPLSLRRLHIHTVGHSGSNGLQINSVAPTPVPLPGSGLKGDPKGTWWHLEYETLGTLVGTAFYDDAPPFDSLDFSAAFDGCRSYGAQDSYPTAIKAARDPAATTDWIVFSSTSPGEDSHCLTSVATYTTAFANALSGPLRGDLHVAHAAAHADHVAGIKTGARSGLPSWRSGN